MAIVFPDETIAQHWNGALQASLKRAPLEEFLRCRGLKVAPRGSARDSDNISRATLFILASAVGFRAAERQALSAPQFAFIGQATCSVCDGLASLIGEPRSWRVAALVSTTQLMPRNLRLFAAASVGAIAAREFASRSQNLVDEFYQMGQMASESVARNSELLIQQLRVRISSRIDEIDSAAVSDLERCVSKG